MDGPRADVVDITRYAYDKQRRLTQTTNALGKLALTGYDDDGRPVREARQFGAQWMVSCVRYSPTGQPQRRWGPAKAFEHSGEELMGLQSKDATDNWAKHHLSTARPQFSPLINTAPGLEGPSSGELGLGNTVTAGSRTVFPLFWCRFRTGDVTLFLFADNQIPMNVGISASAKASGEGRRLIL